MIYYVEGIVTPALGRWDPWGNSGRSRDLDLSRPQYLLPFNRDNCPATLADGSLLEGAHAHHGVGLQQKSPNLPPFLSCSLISDTFPKSQLPWIPPVCPNPEVMPPMYFMGNLSDSYRHCHSSFFNGTF